MDQAIGYYNVAEEVEPVMKDGWGSIVVELWHLDLFSTFWQATSKINIVITWCTALQSTYVNSIIANNTLLIYKWVQGYRNINA